MNRTILAAIAVLLITPTVLLAQKVSEDYDHHTAFAAYNTYTWIKQPKMQNVVIVQRVMEDVNAELELKGLRYVEGDADVAVAAHAATQQEQTLETFYTGWAGWRWNGFSDGTAIALSQPYTVGTLVVDLFDGKTKQLIWRGTATETFSEKPQKNGEKIRKSIYKMFDKFPPH